MELSLYLIQQELKIRKLFSILRKAGMEECYYEPYLDKLILASVGLDDGLDETYDFYTTLIEKRCKKIKPDQASIMKQAVKVYFKLVERKKARQ